MQKKTNPDRLETKLNLKQVHSWLVKNPKFRSAGMVKKVFHSIPGHELKNSLQKTKRK